MYTSLNSYANFIPNIWKQGECVLVYDDKKFFLIVCLFLDFSWFSQNLCFFVKFFFLRVIFWILKSWETDKLIKKILKYCRKNHVLKIYILKYVSKWKMDVIFVIKVAWAFLRKLTNRTQVWPFTLRFINFIIFSVYFYVMKAIGNGLL